ncbi:MULTISPECIES: Flp family type IVb pilin [Limnobacter]|uniref:Flp family type IVb pilin n=1 Tax=Limnobacter litoralis TaxID=481366 RepID=A0ABQ5YTU0_9BURK|nr:MULTISPECIES: Flp family type IVb pilin [Limnobacter]GLR26871.1 hypothetical protein GCM10007875_19610 [Limnobacter litoralis]
MKKVSQLPLVKKNKQEGASLIEYAVIAALIVGIAVLVFPTLQTGLSTAFSNISAQLSK